MYDLIQKNGILKGKALEQVSKGQRPLAPGGPPEAPYPLMEPIMTPLMKNF